MKALELAGKSLMISVFFFLVLFISAGRINYWQGWLYVFMNLVMTLMTVLDALKNSDLMSERLAPGEGTKNWDKIILALSAPVYIIMIIVSGLDSGRYYWTSNLHWSIYLSGIVLTLFGHRFFLIAKKQNRFFSTVVRIQTERGHTVCETGLYRFVRHPGYLGMIISTIGFPFLMGSLWSILPVIISIALLIIRTSLEDKTLIDELTGYKEYKQKTKYKLIPKIW